MSKNRSNKHNDGIEKMGYQKSCWAIRPRHFVGLDRVSVHKKDDTHDPSDILKLNTHEVIDHIRNNGSMYNFTCDTCGDKLGQVLGYVDGKGEGDEKGLVMFIYHPDDGFTFSDEYGRKDHCYQCIKDYSMKICRVGIFDRRFTQDQSFQFKNNHHNGIYYENDFE